MSVTEKTGEDEFCWGNNLNTWRFYRAGAIWEIRICLFCLELKKNMWGKDGENYNIDGIKVGLGRAFMHLLCLTLFGNEVKIF